MGCFGGGKKVDVVPCTADDVGRLESEAGSKQQKSGRDGLSTAPSPNKKGAAGGERSGLHSAPTPSDGLGGALGDFIIEGPGGPTAEQVDAYLTDVLGPKVVKSLRASEWSERVTGLEQLTKLVQENGSAAAPSTPRPTGSDGEPLGESAARAALFRAIISVLARALQDKVVPVFLPAISLLTSVYCDEFLKPLGKDSTLPRNALPTFAGQLVSRAGSSNQRAREESSAALLHLARCATVGAAAIGPWALKPLSKVSSKSTHAAVGRVELLHSCYREFGLGESSGLELAELLSFVLPLCESASDKSRDVASALVLDVRTKHNDPERVTQLITELRPAVLLVLNARTGVGLGATTLASLAVSGRSALPPLAGDANSPNDARAKARATATELGARSPPKPARKPFRPPKARPQEGDEDVTWGKNNNKLFDRSEEQLMSSILQDTAA